VFSLQPGASQYLNHGARLPLRGTAHAAGVGRSPDGTHGVGTALHPRQRPGLKTGRNGLAWMFSPKRSKCLVNFVPASIENLDVEGKQKPCTPGGVPPCLPAPVGRVARGFLMTSDATQRAPPGFPKPFRPTSSMAVLASRLAGRVQPQREQRSGAPPGLPRGGRCPLRPRRRQRGPAEGDRRCPAGGELWCAVRASCPTDVLANTVL
jgi:hypothetical protein